MGRGVSAGGGQSSLGYLFGNNETANNAPAAKSVRQGGNNIFPSAAPAPAATQPIDKQLPAAGQSATAATQPTDKRVPAGVHGYLTNNYQRAEGQNCGNYITERPSTKVHAAPGGASSLGYLFGGGENTRSSPRK
ncbi:protein SPIRAL1-like 2 [Euphorbia lathyris]|uniref:protein SPIRAL1-like 2 n=1 Tax=Euphorbia lathyris TaxID=212925 RepID=UPI0033141F97